MLARERLAQRAHDLVVVEPFDGRDAGAIAGNGERDAGARRHTVDEKRAGTAHAVLATEVRAGEVERITHEVRELRPRLDARRNDFPVDRHVDRLHARRARSMARFRATTWIWLS